MKTSTLRNAISIALLVAAIGTSEWAMAQDTTTDTATQGRAPVTKAPARTPPKKSTDKSAAPAATNLQTVTVTGTRIRGGTTPSPVITIGSEQIQEEGFTDLGEVIRSVPQNFSGGQNPGVAAGANMGAAGLANQNITGGSSLNLRGLGPDATLTLLNGRRLSYGGFVQAVDISAIPVEAVDRLEIVADGASAIYGSDAVGGVGNVVLKRDFDGVSVGARYGVATEGGMATREYTAVAGTTWTDGGVMAAYKGDSVDPIYTGQRDYTGYMAAPTTIYPGSDLHSGLVSAHQMLGDSAELHLDALRTERHQHVEYVWGGNNRLSPTTTTSFVAPSIDILMPGDWTVTVGAAWGRDEHIQYQQRTGANSGATTLLVDDCYCNESSTIEVGAEGPLFSLGGGDARLAAGVGYRKNSYTQTNRIAHVDTVKGSESNRFAYAEIDLPFVDPGAHIAGVERLTATAAIRAENHGRFGSISTPKLGLIYDPSADFTVAATWGKSFKEPTLYQRYSASYRWLDRPQNYGGAGYPADATILFRSGGNPSLDPERARTWTASLKFHPEALPRLETALTWFDIDYRDRVIEPITNYAEALSNPIYAEFVDRTPTAEEQAAVLAGAGKFYNFTGTAYDPDKVVAIIGAQYVNATRQRVKGLDLSGSYRWDLSEGDLTVRGSASWLESSQQTRGTPAAYDLAGTIYNPAKVKGRFGAVWSSGRFSTGAFANYVAGITNTLDGRKTASFTTVDADVRYHTGDRGHAWSRIELALSAQNLFNRVPPLHTVMDLGAGNRQSFPYDSTNYSAIGRFLSLSVTKHW
ncbi:MAG: TonB-dependent receptor plug domain-containing protein [Rhodanobacter sp.]